MRSTLSTAAVLLSALQLATAQTFTDCDPTKKTCPADDGIGKAAPFVTDFTKVSGTAAPDGWSYADGTTMSYDSSNGANFKITTKVGAPTVSTTKYIMFGNVTVNMKASPGTGIVSSFILESDDLDEIDWEWLGATDTSVESNFFGKGNVTTYDRAIYHPMTAAITAFHEYTIVWTSEYVKWLIDGKEVRNLPYADPKALGGKNFPQSPMKIKMGNWVGCADAAAAADPKTQGTCQWAGGPASFDNGASYSMLVKSVTINDYGCGGKYTYSDMSGDFKSIKSSNEGPNCGASSGPSSSSASGSSAGSSTAASSTAASSTATGTATTTSGGVLAQSSSGSNASATGTGSSSGGSGSSNGTTLATTAATPTGTSGSGSGSGSGASGASSKATGASSTTTGGPAQVTANAANAMKPKHKYGGLDVAVMVLGLGLGYFIM
jgi:beta-glucanase (GH16 family)